LQLGYQNQCRGRSSQEHAHRQVFASHYHRFLHENKVFNASTEGQAMERNNSILSKILKILTQSGKKSGIMKTVLWGIFFLCQEFLGMSIFPCYKRCLCKGTAVSANT